MGEQTDPGLLNAGDAAPRGRQQADIAGSWREMVSGGNGRKYYYNTVTKATMWEMPSDYAAYLEQQREPVVEGRSVLEQRFLRMLSECGVTASMRWEEALRLIIGHPHYKGIPSLAERKALHGRFCDGQRALERDKLSRERDRHVASFCAMLDRLLPPEAYKVLRTEEALELVKEEPEFRLLPGTKERAEAFRAHARHQGDERVARGAKQFAAYLQKTGVSLRSRSTFGALLAGDRLGEASREYPDVGVLRLSDLLLVFEDHMRADERAEEDRRRRPPRRHLPGAFTGLLHRLVAANKITALSTWPHVLTLVAGDPAFEEVVLVSPQVALEAFWGVIGPLQEEYVRVASPLLAALLERYPEDECGRHILHPLLLQHLHSRDIANQPLPGSPSTEEGPQTEALIERLRREHRDLLDRLKTGIRKFKSPRITRESRFEDVHPALRETCPAYGADLETAVADPGAALLVQRYYFEKYIRHLATKT